MGEQTKRLSTRERQQLQPIVERAQRLTKESREAWAAVGELLDEFGSKNHSQCCPIGGMSMSGRNGFSGEMPCPCGWETRESVEDVLRRMIAFLGKRLSNPTDDETADLVTDGLAALNRAKAK